MVIAATYNYQTHTAEFEFLHNRTERDVARDSKYMQSNPGYIFRNAELWLKENPEKRCFLLVWDVSLRDFGSLLKSKDFGIMCTL